MVPVKEDVNLQGGSVVARVLLERPRFALYDLCLPQMPAFMLLSTQR